MIKAIIVDDEADSRETLRTFISDYCPDIEVLGEADSVIGAKELILSLKPDLALLDIEINGGTGMDILLEMPTIFFKTIFITGFEEYAVQAFRFSAIDYILKPVNFRELGQALDKVRIQMDLERFDLQRKTLANNLDSNKRKMIVLSTQEQITAVNIDDIVRCESSGSYTTFYLKDGSNMLISKGLKDYEELLKGYDFIRVHQSHLVNLLFFESYLKKDEMIKLSNQDLVPLSNRKKEAFLLRIREFG